MYLDLPGVRVHVSFLFAAFAALALHGARTLPAAVLFFSALLHECAHLVFLLSFGCRGLTLTLLPGGARISGAGLQALPYQKALLCVLAGPGVNLLLAAALFLCAARFPAPVFRLGAKVNLQLGAFNLLPLSFLDGGRALQSLAALKAKSPVPDGAFKFLDLCVVAALSVLTAALAAMGRDALFLLVFTAYCILCAAL